MDTKDKKEEEPQATERAASPLPEHMDPVVKKHGNRPQATAGTRTPGRLHRKRDMSEAAERKARRDEIVAEEKLQEKK